MSAAAKGNHDLPFAKNAYQNDSSALRSLRQMRLQPIARKASWMSARRS
jgi:hypothetical protein